VGELWNAILGLGRALRPAGRRKSLPITFHRLVPPAVCKREYFPAYLALVACYDAILAHYNAGKLRLVDRHGEPFPWKGSEPPAIEWALVERLRDAGRSLGQILEGHAAELNAMRETERQATPPAPPVAPRVDFNGDHPQDLILLALRKAAGTYVTIQEIARLTTPYRNSCSERTVQRKLPALCEQGLVEVNPENGRGRRITKPGLDYLAQKSSDYLTSLLRKSPAQTGT
jgi:hypothetical protein